MSTVAVEWLTIPDLVERWDVSPGRIRRLIEDNYLLARKIDGVLQVPEPFVLDTGPLPELHGTVVVLRDCGFSADEALSWLIEKDEMLGTSPILALLAGRKAEVRRIAQALA